MDWSLDELLSEFHSHQPPPLPPSATPNVMEGDALFQAEKASYIRDLEELLMAPEEEEEEEVPSIHASLGLLSSLPPPPGSPPSISNEDIPPPTIVLPPPADFRDEEPPPPKSSSLLLRALRPKSPTFKSNTDLLINEINELSELFPNSSPWNGGTKISPGKKKIDLETVVAQLGILTPCSPSSLPLSHPQFSQPSSKLCIIPKREEVPESDSGIESVDSLSPKEDDLSPACSPSDAKRPPPVLSSLLSTAPEPTKSSALLSSLLNHSSTSEIISALLETPKATQPQTSSSMTAVNPKDLIIVKKEPNPLNISVLLEDPAHRIHSALESLGSPKNGLTWSEKRKRSASPNDGVDESVSEDFDVDEDALGGNKRQVVVPPWDTDLNLRLRQLDSVLEEKKDLKCDVCGSTGFDSQSELRLHRTSTHTFECPHCDMRFNTGGARNSHKRKVHRRDFLCKTCDVAFGSAQKLERHLKTHTGIKEFKCETCGKEFMIEKNLNLHYKLHSGQKDFQCSICSRAYYTKSGLQAHQKQIHSTTEGDFPCRSCSLTFITKYDLLLHRKVHAGQFSEKCKVCNTGFKTLGELKAHVSSKHAQRQFPCSHCPLRFKTAEKRDQHASVHEEGARETFQCSHCDKSFVFKNSMKKHLEKGRCQVLKKAKLASSTSFVNPNFFEGSPNFDPPDAMNIISGPPPPPGGNLQLDSILF